MTRMKTFRTWKATNERANRRRDEPTPTPLHSTSTTHSLTHSANSSAVLQLSLHSNKQTYKQSSCVIPNDLKINRPIQKHSLSTDKTTFKWKKYFFLYFLVFYQSFSIRINDLTLLSPSRSLIIKLIKHKKRYLTNSWPS